MIYHCTFSVDCDLSVRRDQSSRRGCTTCTLAWDWLLLELAACPTLLRRRLVRRSVRPSSYFFGRHAWVPKRVIPIL